MKSWDSDECNRGSQQGAVVCVEVHKMVQEPFQEQHSEVTTTAGQSLTRACVYEVTDCSLQNEVFYLLCFCSNKLNFQDISNARINNTYLPYTDQQDMEQKCLAGPDTNQEELVRDLKVRDKPGCRNREMVEIRTLR